MVTSRRHSRQQDGIRSIDRASGVPFARGNSSCKTDAMPQKGGEMSARAAGNPPQRELATSGITMIRGYCVQCLPCRWALGSGFYKFLTNNLKYH